jgi:Zn finger protein HypA/HybF involved in hydrogenase expression
VNLLEAAIEERRTQLSNIRAELVCTSCGKNDQEPLAACPKCTLSTPGAALPRCP